MKMYVLENEEHQPKFKYFVQQNYYLFSVFYLFNDFDKAYEKMKELHNSCILEPLFISVNKEWRMRRTFICRNGKTEYLGDQGDVLLLV